MNRKVFIVFVVFLSPFFLTARTNQEDTTVYNANTVFQSVGVTAFSGLMYMKNHFFYKTYQDQITNKQDSFLTTEEWAGFMLLGCTYEWRKNIYHYRDKASFSLSCPAEFGLVYFTNAGRLGELTLPLYADLNFGMHSTWNNINTRGVHFGFGYQWVMGGLIRAVEYGEGNFRNPGYNRFTGRE